LLLVLVQTHFAQHKQFNETNAAPHTFQQISDFITFPECFCGLLKTLSGHMWLVGTLITHLCNRLHVNYDRNGVLFYSFMFHK